MQLQLATSLDGGGGGDGDGGIRLIYLVPWNRGLESGRVEEWESERVRECSWFPAFDWRPESLAGNQLYEF